MNWFSAHYKYNTLFNRFNHYVLAIVLEKNKMIFRSCFRIIDYDFSLDNKHPGVIVLIKTESCLIPLNQFGVKKIYRRESRCGTFHILVLTCNNFNLTFTIVQKYLLQVFVFN